MNKNWPLGDWIFTHVYTEYTTKWTVGQIITIAEYEMSSYKQDLCLWRVGDTAHFLVKKNTSEGKKLFMLPTHMLTDEEIFTLKMTGANHKIDFTSRIDDMLNEIDRCTPYYRGGF